MAHILVVEDNAVVRMLCVEVLDAEGHDVVGVETAADALAVARHRPDLALIDVNLGGQDGVELGGQLNIPVLFMSGSQPPDLDQRMSAVGTRVAFIKKPFEIKDLLAEVAEALQPATS